MATTEHFEAEAERLLGDPRITKTKMFGAVGLKVNGKVFAMLVNGALVVKLPQPRVEALVAAGGGVHFDPSHGRLMKQWVAVEPRDADGWRSLAEEARDFVANDR